MTPHLPDLRIVPADSLVLHEQHDPQRSAPLVARLRGESVLKNPPVVAPLGDGDPRFVVLDGANRVTAFRGMGLPHALVQVVDYESPDVRLTTWNHVLVGIRADDLRRDLSALPRLSLEAGELPEARAALARRELLAYVVAADGSTLGARTSASDLNERTRLLNRMVDTYKDRARLYRTDTDQIREVARMYPQAEALVVFPHYEPAEILTLARHAAYLPAGITRHVVQRRALRLNFPMAELRSEAGLAEKNRRLAEWLRDKVARREVRFYAESTFLFDD